MRKHFIFIFTIFALLVGSMTFFVSSANAASGTSGCITKAEFSRIDEGDSNGTVQWIIVGAHGRVTSSNFFSDGDAWKTLEFRQCGKSWRQSWVRIDFEKSEYERWVPNYICWAPGDCEDYGYYETRYRAPYEVTGKYAVWF